MNDLLRLGALRSRLALALVGVMLVSAAAALLVNRYMVQYPPDLRVVEDKALVALHIVWTALLLAWLGARTRLSAYTAQAPRTAAQAPHTAAPASGMAALSAAHWRRLIALPSGLFAVTAAAGLATAPVHGAIIALSSSSGESFASGGQLLALVQHTLLDATAALLLAVIIYSIGKIIVRAHLDSMPAARPASVAVRPFSMQLIVAFAGLAAFAAARFFVYVAGAQLAGQPVRMLVLFGLSGATMAAGAVIVLAATLHYQRNARGLTVSIRTLLRQQIGPDRRNVPIAADDETGELAIALNELQQRLGDEYGQLQQELKLSRTIRQTIMTAGQRRVGRWTLAVRPCADDMERPDGLDFYDMLDAPNGRSVAIVGVVPSGGAAGTLMISAVLALFRHEAAAADEAAAIAARLALAVRECFPDDDGVAFGIALVGGGEPQLFAPPSGRLRLERADQRTVLCTSTGGGAAIAVDRAPGGAL